MSNEPLVLRTSEANGVVTLTLNQPQSRNALSSAMIAALQNELDRLRTDRSARVVVLAAAGPVFCSGHDLKEMRAQVSQAFYSELFQSAAKLMLTLTRLPQPVIAKIQGTATAAGCQLVATCDLAIAVEGAKFATPGVNIGLFCSTPMVALTRNIGPKAAMEMLLTGEPIDAAEAVRLGLINRAVPAAELDRQVQTLTTQLLSKSPLTLAIGKEAFYRQAEMDLEAAYAYAAEVMTKNMLTQDAGEGLGAFFEKRLPCWRGE